MGSIGIVDIAAEVSNLNLGLLMLSFMGGSYCIPGSKNVQEKNYKNLA